MQALLCMSSPGLSVALAGPKDESKTCKEERLAEQEGGTKRVARAKAGGKAKAKAGGKAKGKAKAKAKALRATVKGKASKAGPKGRAKAAKHVAGLHGA